MMSPDLIFNTKLSVCEPKWLWKLYVLEAMLSLLWKTAIATFHTVIFEMKMCAVSPLDVNAYMHVHVWKCQRHETDYNIM